MDKAIMIGLDIAKNVFEVRGCNAAGEVVVRRSLKRSRVEKFFARQPAVVIGATAWLHQVQTHPEKASPWLRGMLARRPRKVVAVAQAARTARILWAMLTHDQPYRAPAVA